MINKEMIAFCGTYCGVCEWKDKIGCKGCKANQGMMFWGECDIAKCCIEKGLEHCGECSDMPCQKLRDLFADSEHGDHGARLRNLRNWKDGIYVFEKLGNAAQEKAKNLKEKIPMTRKESNKWFTIDQIDEDTYIISEYRHWEETHCYLLNGSSRSLLIDTGLGICNIYDEIMKLTNKPVTAVATHIHWDHIGGHKYFPDFYAHVEELSWLSGEFPLTIETIREMVADRCDLPDGYDTGTYEFFQGTPTKLLEDGENIELGGRNIQVLHTPGHAPGHMCFWESDRGYLFTGDLVYKDTLFAYYPSTDPDAYLASLEKISELPVKKVFPAHHSLDIQPEILSRMRNAFRQLREDGKLHHGSGTFDYGDWAVWL